MALFLLDTTVLIDYLRGRPVTQRIDALRRGGDGLSTSAVNVEEVVRGLRESEQPIVDDLVNAISVIPITDREARRAGDWRRDFAARGITLSQADCLIAASASSMHGVIATGNPKHFPMTDTSVEHWPVGR